MADNSRAPALDLELAKGGDVDAWMRLVEIHAPMIFAHLYSRLRRYDVVNTLVVATLVSAWRNLAEATPDDLGPWLRRQAGAHAMTWITDHPNDSQDQALPSHILPDDSDLAAAIAQIDDTLWSLPEQQRRILELYYVGGLRDGDLAQAMHRDSAQTGAMLREALTAVGCSHPGGTA